MIAPLSNPSPQGQAYRIWMLRRLERSLAALGMTIVL